MDAGFELYAAIIARLKASAAVSAFVGNRVYDRVPSDPKPSSPYISMGPSDATQDDAECIAAQDIVIQIDIWSWGAGEAFGSAEVRKISGAVGDALHEAPIVLSNNALVMIEHRVTRVMRDPDGVTNHAAMSFSAFIET